MRTLIAAALALGLVGLSAAQDKKADPVGTWKCEYEIGGQKREATLKVKNFPDRLYRRIKQLAGKNRRSISQEVVHLLEAAMSGAPPASLLELQGLGKDVWKKELGGGDAAEHIDRERDAWS